MFSCGRCDNLWGGASAAHCASCHNHTFASVDGFDTHRHNGKCLDPLKVKDPDGELVFTLRLGGRVPVWALKSDPDYDERFGRNVEVAT